MSVDSNSTEYFKKRIYSINHPGMHQNEMLDGYKDWSTVYDQDLAANAYSAPKNTASILQQRFPEDTRRQIRILDVGAGTGLVADELTRLGFVRMDALEPVTDMLDVARLKGIYENYYEEFLSAEEPTTIPADTYDCVTGAGCFTENHIPCESISELLRVVKPGGLIAIATKVADTDYFKGLNALLDEMVKDGRLAKQEITQGLYLKGIQGRSYILTVA